MHDLELKELVLPLVVIDQSARAQKDADFALSAEDVLAFEQIHGRIESGSFVACAHGLEQTLAVTGTDG